MGSLVPRDNVRNNIMQQYTAPSSQDPMVYIAGAGPGDPELLTLRTHRLLTSWAEIVVYDRLVPEAILAMIPEHVTRIYAGKSCRKHEMTQEEINRCLVEQAQAGKRVLRLKSGDPFVFGRGGEEMHALLDAGIAFDIVPGISAADGCAVYAGIPLTHRTIASSVRFITGHQQKGEAVPLDWPGLVDPHTTLVIYMGLTHLDDICEKLIAHGLDPDTPAACIQEGTTAKQRICFAPIKLLYQDITSRQFAPPSIIIIGKVVALSPLRNKERCYYATHEC